MKDTIKKYSSWRTIKNKISGILRVAYVAVLVIIQVVFLFILSKQLKEFSPLIFFIIEIISLIFILSLFGSSNHSQSYRMIWIIAILIFPFVGITLYLSWGNVNMNNREKGYVEKTFKKGKAKCLQDDKTWSEFSQIYPDQIRVPKYLKNNNFPIYTHTESKYYPLGEVWWKALLEDLEKAEKFIFMEYFIVDEGEVWSSILDVLERKVKEGVYVRFMYDDMGSVLNFGKKDRHLLRAKGLDVQVFNPVNRYTSSFYINYRNHQKITVIDGNIGYIGGTNLADEYANLFAKHGHWKDTCMRLYGDAVWTLTVTFLQMWDMTAHKMTEDYDQYRPTQKGKISGYYQPMSDGPANNPKNPGLDMYKLSIINAKKYCYITTPYLVIDDDLVDTLCLAAKGGVDVRIIVPHIPDHWYVHLVSQSFYGILMESGIRIYEYTPGYMHAKMIVSDDINAVLGSINLDFRSFFLHYENAVWICDAPIINDIKKDIVDTMAISQEILLLDWNKRSIFKRFLQLVLRLISPMF